MHMGLMAILVKSGCQISPLHFTCRVIMSSVTKSQMKSMPYVFVDYVRYPHPMDLWTIFVEDLCCHLQMLTVCVCNAGHVPSINATPDHEETSSQTAVAMTLINDLSKTSLPTPSMNFHLGATHTTGKLSTASQTVTTVTFISGEHTTPSRFLASFPKSCMLVLLSACVGVCVHACAGVFVCMYRCLSVQGV